MPVEKEPVDIFDTSGTSPTPFEEAEELDEEDAPDGDEEEQGDEDADDEDTDDEEGDEEDEDGDEGDDEDGDDEPDPKDAEIERLKGLLKTKNQALRGMRKGRVAESTEEFKPPYPDLKRSNELPEDEQEEMTTREKKLHDDNIEVKERLNADAQKAWEREQAEKAESINEDALTDDEVEDFVKASAQYLAKGDKKLANQVIKKFNQFNNEGLTEEQIEDRLGEAMKLVTGFKKPKEQAGSKGRGKSVKKKANKHGIDTDKIVEEAVGDSSKKNYEL